MALFLIVIVGAVLASTMQSPPQELRAKTNEARVGYLESLGWEVDSEPIDVITRTLPEELAEPYLSYNEIQLRQGFDLTPFLGKTLERYTYTVKNYPNHPEDCQADIYLSDGVIIAGGIICTGTNGFIATLNFPATGNG